MAANLSDNLKITKAPPVGAFALRRYDRGIREVHCISTPVISSVFIRPYCCKGSFACVLSRSRPFRAVVRASTHNRPVVASSPIRGTRPPLAHREEQAALLLLLCEIRGPDGGPMPT